MPGSSCIPNLEHGGHLAALYPQVGWAGKQNLLWTDQSGSGEGGFDKQVPTYFATSQLMMAGTGFCRLSRCS
jgi:hypothetical protein